MVVYYNILIILSSFNIFYIAKKYLQAAAAAQR